MIDYSTGGELLEAYGHAWSTFDGEAWVALFTEDAEYHGDPFAEPIVGHNALRAFLLESAETQRDVDFAVERHWVSGSTVLAAWHASWMRRTDGGISRVSSFMTAELASDGRIHRLHEWRMMAPKSTG
jgi:ketosteroid isomerase-like protein